jgi:muramidase (phage lysozyme)
MDQKPAVTTASAEYAISQPQTMAAFYGYLVDHHPYVRAALASIRDLEGTSKKGMDPYRVGFGHDYIDDLSRHPNKTYRFSTKSGKRQSTTAAGAYQFLTDTYKEMGDNTGLRDFSPRSQDINAVARIHYRGALEPLLKGDIKTFAMKVGKEWASFPSAPDSYDQPKHSWMDFNRAWGANLADAKGVPRPSSADAARSMEVARGLGEAGILGLDGRLAPERGVPPFERGTWRGERRASAEPERVGSDVTTLASAEISLPQRSPDLMWSGGMMLEAPPPGSWTDFYANIPSVEERKQFVVANPNPFLLERSKLAALNPDMQRIVRRAQEIAGTRFVVGSGVRTAEEQAAMVKRGWSKTMSSDHVKSNGAVDLWPVDDNWAVTFDAARQDMIVDAMKQAAGELGHEIDVGADWKNPDMPHFALRGTAKGRSDSQPFEPTPDDVPIPTPRPQRFGGMPGVGPGNSGRAYAERSDLAPADRIGSRIEGAFAVPPLTQAQPDVLSRLVASASRRTDPASFRVGQAFGAAESAPAVTTDPAALAVAARRADPATARVGRAFSVAGAPQALNPGAPAAIARLRAEHAARMAPPAPTPQTTATTSRLPGAVPASVRDAYAQYAASRIAAPAAKAAQDRLAAVPGTARTAVARGSVNDTPATPYTGAVRMPAPRATGALGALERLAANPISLGQPGGKYAGSGLSAMMGVRSGMSPVGTVAHSRSDPSVSLVSLPHGNVAHVNSKHGTISTWSQVDDDERGTVFGKQLAIDPTASKYGYYSPGKVPAGWSVYSPGKGFSKGISASKSASTGSARSSGLPGSSPACSGRAGQGRPWQACKRLLVMGRWGSLRACSALRPAWVALAVASEAVRQAGLVAVDTAMAGAAWPDSATITAGCKNGKRQIRRLRQHSIGQYRCWWRWHSGRVIGRKRR